MAAPSGFQQKRPQARRETLKRCPQLPIVVCAVAAAFLAPALQCDTPAGSASEPPAPYQRNFGATVDVELLELQAVVTDGDGERVYGLSADDFRVFVGDTERPIELFEEVRSALSPTEPATVAADGVEAPPPQPTHYLVFIDDLMTLARNRDFVLQRLRDDLALMRPGDSMAVVRLGEERKMRILADWTDDRAQLEAAIDRAMTEEAWGIKYVALRRMRDFVANWEGNDTRRSVLAAAGALRRLDVPEGRRALLLVAGSWDPVELQRAGRFSDWCVTGWCQGASVYNVLTDTANLLGYAIYAIDVEGTDLDFDWNREKRLHAVLGELARLTGGLSMLNGERATLLATAVEDTSSYYSLAVPPPEERGDRRLEVRIEVLREGLEVRSQETAVPISDEQDRQLDVLNALWRDAGDEEGFAVEVTLPRRLRRGLVEASALVTIDPARLGWLEVDGRQVAEVILRVAALDNRGNSSAVESRRLSLVRGSDEELIVFPWSFQLRHRRHTLVFDLEDRIDRHTYLAVEEFEPRFRELRDEAAAAGHP